MEIEFQKRGHMARLCALNPILARLASFSCRGHLTNVQSGSLFTSSPSLYVACHNTAPPPGQLIKTDPTSIIIRAIQARKGQDLAKKKQNPKPGEASCWAGEGVCGSFLKESRGVWLLPGCQRSMVCFSALLAALPR